LHAANKAKELLQPDEIRSYFQCMNALKTYKPESFRQLITKINKNAYTPVARCSLGDPENVAIQQFMKQNKEMVEKIWEQIQAEERGLNTEANEDVARSIIIINEPEAEVASPETQLISDFNDVARSPASTQEPTSGNSVAVGITEDASLIDDAAENSHGIVSVEFLEQPSTSKTKKTRKRKVPSENPVTTDRPKRTCTIRK
jgi:hypothetical protein